MLFNCSCTPRLNRSSFHPMETILNSFRRSVWVNKVWCAESATTMPHNPPACCVPSVDRRSNDGQQRERKKRK